MNEGKSFIIEDYFIHLKIRLAEYIYYLYDQQNLKKKKKVKSQVHVFNLITQRTKADRSLWTQWAANFYPNKHSLNSKLQVSQGFIVRPWREGWGESRYKSIPEAHGKPERPKWWVLRLYGREGDGVLCEMVQQLHKPDSQTPQPEFPKLLSDIMLTS